MNGSFYQISVFHCLRNQKVIGFRFDLSDRCLPYKFTHGPSHDELIHREYFHFMLSSCFISSILRVSCQLVHESLIFGYYL